MKKVDKETYNILFKNNFYKEEMKRKERLFPLMVEYQAKNKKGCNKIFEENKVYGIRIVVEGDGSQRQWINNEEVTLEDAPCLTIGLTKKDNKSYSYKIGEKK